MYVKPNCPNCGKKFAKKGLGNHMRHCKQNRPEVPNVNEVAAPSMPPSTKTPDQPDYFQGRRDGIREGRLDGFGDAVVALGYAIKNRS